MHAAGVESPLVAARRPARSRIVDLARATAPRLCITFILFHALAVTILSLPAPPASARRDDSWQQPHVRAQILKWVQPFRPLLGERDDDAVLELARHAAVAVLDVRDVVVAPFSPYAEAIGIKQGWQMFSSIVDRPGRLRIRVSDSYHDPWRTVYLARDAEHDWRRALLDDERIRRLSNDWSWGGGRTGYRAFAQRLALLVADDHPEARWVEVAMVRAPLPTPQRLAAGIWPEEQATWVEQVHVNAAGDTSWESR